MATEQHGTDVEMRQLEPQPVVSIRASVPIAHLGEAMDDRLRALSRYLQQRGVQPAGPPFVRYHTFGDTETDLETGIPVMEPVVGEDHIVGGELPGGPAITIWHLGGHDTLGNAYARLGGGVTAAGRAPRGAAWEVYYWIDPAQYTGAATWPDPSEWRTQLVQPIHES